MKQKSSSVRVMLLAIAALLITGANQSVQAHDNSYPHQSGAIFATSAADGGRLLIKRSPVLGYNVQIVFWIDGQLAGTSVRGHLYDRYITPGRHILVGFPNRSGAAWRGVLDVRAGQTYFYIASYNVTRLVLTPVTGFR
jgi:hypothetical protein